VWDRRSWEAKLEHKRPKYRYDVTYEKRTACCRAREACCIRGVKTKVIGATKKPVRIVSKKDKKKERKAAKKAAKKEVAAMTESEPKQYRWDVEYERVRASCCSSKKACCRAPLNMYHRSAVDAGSDDGSSEWVVVARTDQSSPFVRAGLSKIDDDELEILTRIQARQRLLHTLLLTHDSPYYDEDVHVLTASDAHIVQYHEPASASGGRIEGYGRDGDLTREEFQELQNWLRQLPVVPHLSVVEVDAKTSFHTADEDAAFIEVEPKQMVPAKVLAGFVDIEQQPHTLAQLLSALPTPAIAADL